MLERDNPLESVLIPVQPKRRVSLLALLSVTIVVVVSCCLVGLWVWQRSNANRLNAQLADLRIQGCPTTTAELVATYQPEAGSRPLFLAAGKSLRESIQQLYDIQRPNGGPQLPYPPPGTRWEQLPAARKYVAGIAPELAQIYRDAESSVVPRYDVRPGIPRVGTSRTDDIIPYNSGHGFCRRALMLAAFVHAHDGDVDGVVRDLHSAFRLADSVRDEPHKSLFDLGVATIDDLAANLPSLLNLEFSDEQLAGLQRTIRDIDLRKSWFRSLEGSVVLSAEVARNPRKWNASGNPMLGGNILLQLEMIEALLAVRDAEWHEIRQVCTGYEAMAEGLQENPIQKARYAGAISGLIVKARVFDTFAKAESQLAILNALIATKRYYRKSGHLPGKLSDLVPEFLLQIPVDPMSEVGDPLLFRNEGAIVMIYGRGFNRQDDGGSLERQSGLYNQPPDIVMAFAPADRTPSN